MRAFFGFLLLAFIGLSAAGADDAKPKKPVKRDPKALEILKQSATLYQKAATVHVDTAIDMEVQNGDEKQEFHNRGSWDLAKPDRFALRARPVEGKDAGVDFVSDGKTLLLYSVRFKQYTESPAPKRLVDVVPLLARVHRSNSGFWVPNLLTDDPYESLVEDIISCSYAGKEKLGDAEAHHVKVVHPESKWEVWIAADGKPHALKIVTLVAVDEIRISSAENYRNWKLDEKPEETAFSTTPPPGAVKSDTIGPPRPKK
jgi:hypothetical protein